MQEKIGQWAFTVGVVIALVLGTLSNLDAVSNMAGQLAAVLIVLGLIVGFLNVSGHETKDFLLVAAVLLISAGNAALLKEIPLVGEAMAGTFTYLLMFIMPQTLVVCLKAVFGMSKDA